MIAALRRSPPAVIAILLIGGGLLWLMAHQVTASPGVLFWLGVLALWALVCIVSRAGTTFGAVDYEPFDYSGTALDGRTGGTGWSGGWFTTGTSQPNTLSDDNASLAYPVPFEAPLITPTTTGGR